MLTRGKILLLFLFTFTCALGALVLLESRHDEGPAIEFRQFLFSHPGRNFSVLFDSLADANLAKFWYVGVALVALVVIVVIFRAIASAEQQAYRDRLVEAEVTKAELETSLQDLLWKEKHARATRDAALKDIEASFNRVVALEDRLSESERLLQSQDKELNSLRLEMKFATKRPVERTAPANQEESEFHETLRKNDELLRAKDAAIQELQTKFAEKLDGLQTQLNARDELIEDRNGQLELLQTKLAETVAAKEQAETFLTREVKKERDALNAKDSAARELADNFAVKVRELESQVGEKQELLQSRHAELEAARSEVRLLTGQLSDAMSAKDRAESVLRQEVDSKQHLLHEKDDAFRELQENLKAKLHSLEAQIADRDELQKKHEQELQDLKAQLTETGAARTRSESLLAEELQREREHQESKDSALKEAEQRFTAIVQALENQIGERQELLMQRNTELEAIRSEVKVLTVKVADAATAKKRAEDALEQELAGKQELLRTKDSDFKELAARMTASVHDLENRLREKNTALDDHKTELASMKDQLAQITATRKDAESSLSQALETVKAKDVTIKELEENLSDTVAPLKAMISEQQADLKSRDEELQTLRFEVQTLNAQLSEMDSVRLANLSIEQPSVEARSQNLDEELRKILALENLMREKEELLLRHGEKIERLEVELKEKRTALAKYEITAWQGYERRVLWKQRLAKFGINIKDREL